MSFIKEIVVFFQALFNSSSPDVKKRQALKKIESDLHDVQPVIYKNDLVQPNFAEAIRILYLNTKPIHEILINTICSDDIQRNERFTEQLILTGFSPDSQEALSNYDYDKLKQQAMESESLQLFIEKRKHTLEGIIKELNTPEMLKIDNALGKLKQLDDICRYNYITPLRLFDINFKSSDLSYKPNFQPINSDLLETSLLDLYYIIANMEITTTLARAVNALQELLGGNKETNLIKNFEKIQAVLKHVLTQDVLEKLIKITKKDPDFVPKHAEYHVNARQKYADYLETRFSANENRLKVEVKDATISIEVNNLFGTHVLTKLNGYNRELNNLLRQNTSVDFDLVIPLEVTKSFFTVYFNDKIKALLNDIVIEGFFNNPSYKTEFSTTVYACNDGFDRLQEFEKKFTRGGEYDEAVISGYIRDSHKDNDFALKLKEVVQKINSEARKILQSETTNIYELYLKIGEMLVDSKKPTPDTISNLKVLLTSTRNRDGSTILEQQFPQWRIFLEIMKNYAIIGNVEINI